MEFIPSPRGNEELLVLDRHIYSEQKQLASNVILWDCLNRRKANSCNAKVKTLNGVLQGRLHHHTHPADPEKLEVMKVRGAMKQRAQNTMEQTRDILSEHETMHLRIGQAATGIPASQPSGVYRELHQQIKNIVRDYPNRNTIQYLRSLSYTIN